MKPERERIIMKLIDAIPLAIVAFVFASVLFACVWFAFFDR
jgi:hypothetical protein